MSQSSKITLSAREAEELLQWMSSVGHVERTTAQELKERGLLTPLHAQYFRRALTGETFTSFRGVQ